MSQIVQQWINAPLKSGKFFSINNYIANIFNLLKRYDKIVEKPGKLLIEVEDCADNYLPVEDSDSFEPDTLDRKPSKIKINRRPPNDENEYVDSLERPQQQILLKSKGSFTNDSPLTKSTDNNDSSGGNFNRMFGSLREIYEAKAKGLLIATTNSNNDVVNRNEIEMTKIDSGIVGDDDVEGTILTLEERHSKRQRQINGCGNVVQPDVIPPPPHHDTSPIYEHPKPPRRIILTGTFTLLHS